MKPFTRSIRYGINPRIDGTTRLIPREIFGREAPLVLEIGSGKGRFLVMEGRARGDVDFLGVEKSLHYYRVIDDRLRRHDLGNVRIINHDAALVMEEMLPPASVDEVHIYFPDPWPRPRERKRRLIRPEVMPLLARVMKESASGIWVTDHEQYFRSGVPVLESWFEVEAGPASGEPRTNYEAKYREEGRPIWEARFRRSASKERSALSALPDG